jgi:hypothetical protein
MKYFLSAIGIVCGYLLIRYREKVGDALGEPAWTNKVGGIYNVLIAIGLFMFFWSLATITNSNDFLFSPILNLFSNQSSSEPAF